MLNRTSKHSPTHHFHIARSTYLAALIGHHAIVLHLLKDSSWTTSPDRSVWGRLFRAAAVNGHVETVKILLADYDNVQACVDPQPQLRLLGCRPLLFGERHIMAAIHGDREDTLKILLNFIDDQPQFWAIRGEILDCALRTVAYYQGTRKECERLLRERCAKLAGE